MRNDSKSTPEFAEQTETRPSANQLTERIIAAAIEVHRVLGPGLMESAYEECLCYELSRLGIQFERQVETPIHYKGLRLSCNYRIDLLIEKEIIIELKAVDDPLPVHSAQVLTYLKSSGKTIGLLINFNVPVLKKGLKRLVNHYTGPAPNASVSAPSANEPEEGIRPLSLDQPILSVPPRNPPRLSVSAVKGCPE